MRQIVGAPLLNVNIFTKTLTQKSVLTAVDGHMKLIGQNNIDSNANGKKQTLTLDLAGGGLFRRGKWRE